jgi:malate permease and related proteins
MILIVIAIIACTAIGVSSERTAGERARRSSRTILTLMLFVLVPFESFFNIARLHLSATVGAGIGLAYLALAITGAIAWIMARRLYGLSQSSAATLVCTAILANTTYLGLPLVSALLGPSHLPTAVAYDTLVSAPMLLFVGFGLGAAFGTRAGVGARERSRAFLMRNPPLIAVIGGLLAPSWLAPHVMVAAAHVVVYALLGLGFYVLGVNLATAAEDRLLTLSPAQRAPVATAIALRMLCVPALLFCFSRLVHLPHAYLLQAAMPSGINTLIIVHVYGLDQRLASAAIAWSTLVAVAGVIVVATVT